MQELDDHNDVSTSNLDQSNAFIYTKSTLCIVRVPHRSTAFFETA